MRVTVRDHPLNVRQGRPSVNAPIVRTLSAGSEIEVDGQLYKGDPVEGISTWVKDEAENYYWSGGVFGQLFKEVSGTDFWYDELEMAEVQKIENGDACNVLILDTGINETIGAFNGTIIHPAQSFDPGSTNTSSNDVDSHGSHCAGLIAARPSEFIVGASLGSKMHVAKITENGELNDAKTLISALTEFTKDQYDFDVISISQGILDEDATLKSLLQHHINKKRIVVAAIGNDSQLNNSNKKRYPGFFDNCISVGACENDKSLSKYTCFPTKVDIFCYGTNIRSYKQDQFPLPLTGTSQSTAIVAGVCALIVSFLKKHGIAYDQNAVRTLLKTYSTHLVGSPNQRLLQPKMIFNKLIEFSQHGKKSLQVAINADTSSIS